MCLITRTAMTVLNVLNRIIQSIEFMLAFRINRCINVSGSGKKIPDFIFCKSYIHYLFYNVINSCYGGRSRTIIFTFFDTYSSFRGFMEIEHWKIDLNCWNKNYFCLQFYNFLHIPLNTKSNSTLYSLSINSETLAVRLIKRADCLINCWHCLNRRLIFCLRLNGGPTRFTHIPCFVKLLCMHSTYNWFKPCRIFLRFNLKCSYYVTLK